jgi:glycerol-3-phosphate acyltransferase PlsX
VIVGGSRPEFARAEPARVAVDLLGDDGASDAVLSGVGLALRADAGLHVSLVGPPQLRQRALAGGGGDARRLAFVPSSQVATMGEDPIRAVRTKPDASVCVAARLVRDGAADAMVSIGSTGAAMAAAVFDLGLLAGLTRAALVVTVPAISGPVALLDVGANMVPAADLLAQHALAGAAYAEARLGIPAPRVGLLTVGEEVGKGDRVRRIAGALLATLPLDFIGNVEGGDVPCGGPADVVVTDGFTGNVLLKGMEGTYALIGSLVTGRLAGHNGPARQAVGAAIAGLHPDRIAGALLLGVDGVVVVGHGASSPGAVAACIAQAATVVREGVLPRLSDSLAGMVARRSQVPATPVPGTRAAR